MVQCQCLASKKLGEIERKTQFLNIGSYVVINLYYSKNTTIYQVDQMNIYVKCNKPLKRTTWQEFVF